MLAPRLSVLAPRRRLTLVVEALSLGVQRGLAGDVRDNLPHDAGLILDDRERTVGGAIVAERHAAELLALLEGPLDDEASRRCGGLFGPGGAPHGDRRPL